MRSCNHCCSGKAINITYCECACTFRYPACSAHTAYYIVICVLPRSAILLHIISQTARFSKKKIFNIKCVFIFCITFARIISRSTSNCAMYDVKCIFVSIWSTRYFYQILMKIEFSPQIFEKESLNIIFYWSHEMGVRVVPGGRMAGQAWRSKYSLIGILKKRLKSKLVV